MPTLAVVILQALFNWRTLTYQMGSGLFWGTSRIAISPSMCTLASPLTLDSQIHLLSQRGRAIKCQDYSYLLMIGDVLYLEPFCWHVVKDLITCYDIIASRDYQGNTALHVAAFGGYLAVAEILILASPSLASFTNNYGDTFLHMAVSGFQTPGFRRVDRQIELFTQSVSGKIVNIKDVANVKNNDGRTAFHTINQLNISDMDAMTPLELLKQQPRSTSSETLIKQLISAGGISCRQDNIARNVIVSHLNGHGIGMSPGTSFRIPDAEVFLYTGIGTSFSNQSLKHKQASFNKKSTNQCFYFGAQGLAVKDSGTNQSYKHATPLDCSSLN
ncbi:hypothetical protein OIU76_011309 [Salix suchowensis]|nr:hypothetical protein OIU76_011309 [Salix suchowensis]